jgi:hypothetical protein
MIGQIKSKEKRAEPLALTFVPLLQAVLISQRYLSDSSFDSFVSPSSAQSDLSSTHMHGSSAPAAAEPVHQQRVAGVALNR